MCVMLENISTKLMLRGFCHKLVSQIITEHGACSWTWHGAFCVAKRLR